MIKELSNKLQELLEKESEKLSIESKFVKRDSKLTGEKFAKGLIFGWQSNPDARLYQLKKTLEIFGVKISEQGLDKRFSKESAEFMELLLNKALSILTISNQVTSGLLTKFSDLKIYDSSSISLPVELIKHWTGPGGTKGSKANSVVKLSASLSLKTGSLKIVLEDGFVNDRNSELIVKDEIEKGSLIIRDLGYYNLESFKKISEHQAYYCSRLKSGNKVFSLSGKEIDIVHLMNNKTFIDKDVIVGNSHQLKCRIVIVRLPEQQKKERIEKLLKKAKREGKSISKKKLALSAFNIFITNLSEQELRFEEVLILMKSRWQIELLFKLWKSYCKIDKSRSEKPYRILTELYTKLLGAIISHHLMIIGMWKNVDRSMFKAIQIIQEHTILISYSFNRGINELANVIEFICSKIDDCIVNKRRENPSNAELLLGLKELYYSFVDVYGAFHETPHAHQPNKKLI
jgi:hypothetical protein